MSVWNLLREFRIRKVHMAIVLNEYGGTVGVSLFFKALCVDVRNVLVFDLVIFMQAKANFKVQL